MSITAISTRLRLTFSLFLGLIFGIAVACGGDEMIDESDAGDVEWGYSGAGAPENWASLSAENAMCTEGIKQSPVDITGYQSGDAPPISFSFRRDAAQISNDGRFVTVSYNQGNRLGLSERTYQLATVHLHTPGEHTLDGQSFAMEMHLVNEQTFGDVAVVAFLYSLGEPDPVIQNIIDAAPAVGETISEGLALNAADYVPEDLGYYKYEGSLTTPPCTEPVDWFVMLQQRTVSKEQVDSLVELTGLSNNNRPIQPLGDRIIVNSGSRK